MKIRKCAICEKEISARYNRKTCSKECNTQYRREYKREQQKKNLVEYACRHCHNKFKRTRKRGGFCTKSCASKYYINNGTYDKWRRMSLPRRGIYKACQICGIEYYIGKAAEQQASKTCSRNCKNKMMSSLFSGKNNPFYGKKETIESKKKKIQTLQERYGITNAYFLAKHKTASKPQLEIMKELNREFGKGAFKKEVKLGKYRVDMLFEKKKIIIEYNGGYWHCDPRFYESKYFHAKKSLYAEEIWKKDEQRIKILEQQGYTIITIWEYDYMQNKQKALEETKELIYGR